MRQNVLKLDALRGMAAQPVAISHASALLFAPSPTMTIIGWTAHLCVIFFFVLSGYAIIGGLRQEAAASGTINLHDYAIRRVARIYPPYLLTLTLVLIYISFADDPRFDTSAEATLRSLAFAFFGHDAITLTPVWSLRIEVVMYAIAGLTAFSLTSGGIVRIFTMLAAASLAILTCWKLSFGPTALVSFACGGVLFAAFGNVSFGKEHAIWKLLAPLGRWSYTLYLIHMPVILATIQIAEPLKLSPLPAVALSIVASNAISAILATIFERPKEFAVILRSPQKLIALQTLR